MVKLWCEYNKTLAQQNRQVAHGAPSAEDPSQPRCSFFRNNDFEEVNAAQRDALHSPYVVLSPISGRVSGRDLALRKNVKCSVFFLGRVVETFDNLEDVQEQTFSVMIEFLSRYERDYRVTGACGPFRKFDLEKAFFQEVGPRSNNDYGWRLDLEFQISAADLTYNPINWK